MTTALPGTRPLTWTGDLAARMVAGIDRYLRRELAAAPARRARHWHRDLRSAQAYERSVRPNRDRLRRIVGATATRRPPYLELVAPVGAGPAAADSARLVEGPGYRAYAVRWHVLPGIDAEGLLLDPLTEPRANVVALGDCEAPPELVAGILPGPAATDAPFARRLAENGCRVLVPTQLDRATEFSGYPPVRMVAQPHREFVYRAAYEMGGHLIGLEVQKVLAAVDWFTAGSPLPVGVIGHAEGGLLALYAAALDTRIAAAAVLGYFGPREGLWQEPIDRNVWSLLDEFGDAELASLVAPRALVVEACRAPESPGRTPSPREQGPTPGVLRTPPLAAVRREAARARALVAGLATVAPLTLTGNGRGQPGRDPALTAFLRALGVRRALRPVAAPPTLTGPLPDARARQHRQVEQLVAYTQFLVEDGERQRAAFWAKADASSLAAWETSAAAYRERFWEDVIGKLPPASRPANPRSRLLYEEPTYTAHEVVMDVYDDVFAYGILLLPKGIAPGERRPAVVCQHGLEGRPQDVAVPPGHPAYQLYARSLAERGFVVFAPQNPYIGYDSFRVLQRLANPLRLSIFSFIVRQHERILEWLGTQPFADPARIAFYGLSYGGKTAMRVPAILPQYALSICSADYNEWVRKNASVSYPVSYLYTGEYEMYEFDLGRTFNYAEMSWLVCPRPFMVERGHHDGVGLDEWVGYEYAKTFRRYSLLGIPERCAIEWFDGPHQIHGQATFDFLHRWLAWPAPATPDRKPGAA